MDIRLLEQTDSYHRLQEVEHVVLLPVHLFLRKCPTEKKYRGNSNYSRFVCFNINL